VPDEHVQLRDLGVREQLLKLSSLIVRVARAFAGSAP
jgi:hypothetical protein